MGSDTTRSIVPRPSGTPSVIERPLAESSVRPIEATTALGSLRPAFASELSTCPSCESHNLPDAKYCQQCGIKLWRESLALVRRSLGPVSIDPRACTEPPPLADPLIGAVIADRYKILAPLGRGGMGVVYKAEHARIGKLMALKLLTGELSRDQKLVARFKREALMASKLSHPNTVQVFDYGTSQGLSYLAMEYLRGEDLGRLIRRLHTLSPTRTAKIVVQICSSLAEAHAKGIVHRDLKPENIIIVRSPSGDDIAKVLDFGLAKLRESSELSEVTTRGAIVGTPYYMSPEQIRGEAPEPRSDVYSLGALTYTCLTGGPVFEASTPMAILACHLTEEPEDPSRRFPELKIPPSLGAIVLKALAKDPARRYASVRELQQALVDELRGEGQTRVEELLDTHEVKRLTATDEETATRAEVERYERKLRRQGQILWASLLMAAASVGFVGFRAIQELRVKPAFRGVEIEANDSAAQAQLLPFGAEVRGQLGQRIDRERSDRDFYRVEVPPDAKVVSLSSTGLPNLATCLLLYKRGLDDPFGRYCTGTPGRDLTIDALKLEPGTYFVALMQDRDRYTDEPAPPVIENISDDYHLQIARSQAASDTELEPNDELRDANIVAPGTTLRGRLTWMRDTDVICAPVNSGYVRFVVDDGQGGARPSRAVLEVTPEGGAGHHIPVRVHRGGAAGSAFDVVTPWTSPSVLVTSEQRACLTLRLAPNPLAPTPQPHVAPASDHEYRVTVQSVPEPSNTAPLKRAAARRRVSR